MHKTKRSSDTSSWWKFPFLRVLFLFQSSEIRAVVTGYSEESGITWWDWREESESEWIAWPLNGKVNEWWLLLFLVIVIKLACLILLPMQCLRAHSMSPGHVLCLTLVCHASWMRQQFLTKPCTYWLLGLPSWPGCFRLFHCSDISQIEWPLPEPAYGLPCRASCHYLLCLWPLAAVGQMDLPISHGVRGGVNGTAQAGFVPWQTRLTVSCVKAGF